MKQTLLMIVFLLTIALGISHLTDSKKEVEAWEETVVWNGDTLWSLASPIASESNLDTRLDYRWLDLRSKKNNIMLKVQSEFVKGMREFLYSEDFTEIHTPKLIGTASESGSEVFEVKYYKHLDICLF